MNSKRRKYIISSIFVLSLIGLTFLIVQKDRIFSTDCEITTPNIVGLQIEQVETFLGNRNIELTIIDTATNLESPRNSILKQTPEPGSKMSDTIFVVVNCN